MSRRNAAIKREILPDPKFSSRLLAKFINMIMKDGKKSTAETIVYEALDTLVSKLGHPIEKAPEIFAEVLDKVKPVVEVRSRRIGGATCQSPHPVREDRRVSLGIKWMITAARKRNEKTMDAKLSAELMAAYKEEGTAYKKKQDTHKMAEANKAFAHFR